VIANTLDALVASSWWEYAAGLFVRGDAVDGLALLLSVGPVRDDAGPLARACSGALRIEALDSKGWRGVVNPDFIRPDIEHTGNHGHMLALVRKAYPGRNIRVNIAADNSTAVEIWRGHLHIETFVGITLGLALAAALLAAPPPKAGEP
jgi:hypothetical protein